MGGLARTGAVHGPTPKPGGVAWAQPVISSSTLDDARAQYGVDAPAHIPSHPVTDGPPVYVGAR